MLYQAKILIEEGDYIEGRRLAMKAMARETKQDKSTMAQLFDGYNPIVTSSKKIQKY